MKTIENVLYLVMLAGPDASITIGLFRGSTLLAETKKTEFRMSAHLVLVLEEVLMVGGVLLRDLDFIAASQGPGLFSHLRALLATCNGIAAVTNISLIGIDYLQAWCDIAAQVYATSDKEVLVVNVYNAYNNEIHYRIERVQGKARSVVAGPAYASVAFVEDLLAPLCAQTALCVLVGEGWRLLSPQALKCFIEKPSQKELHVLALWALTRWVDQDERKHELAPLYLKETQFKKSV